MLPNRSFVDKCHGVRASALLLFICCLLMSAFPAAAQQSPAPRPAPVVPVAPAAPVVPVAPAAPVVPEPPVAPTPFIDLDLSQVIQDATRAAAEAAQFKVDAKVWQNFGAAFQRAGNVRPTNNEDRLYEQGQRELDHSQWS